MYGVPADLDLSVFRGAVLEQIALGQHIIQFHFSGAQRPQISVEGDWQLLGPNGRLLDQQLPSSAREVSLLPLLLGRTVTGYDLAPPDSFSLAFDSGHVLRIFDHSRQHESFSIQPGDIFV